METILNNLVNSDLQNQVAKLQSDLIGLAGLFKVLAVAWFLSVVCLGIFVILQDRAIRQLNRRLESGLK